MKIWKSESPDFILTDGNGIVALEITEATNRDYQVHLTCTEGDDVLELDSDDGFVGSIPELQWVEAIWVAIRRKIEKFEKYAKADQYDLLIYSNHPTDAVRDRTHSFELLISKLEDELKSAPFGCHVGRVSVIDGRFLMFDMLKSPRLLPLIDMMK